MDRFDSSPAAWRRKVSFLLIASYVFDWIILIAVGIVGLFLGNVTPNKRPFQLEDPNISFPYAEHETVSSLSLVSANAIGPIVVIAVIALIFVPGATVPQGTPKSLIWKRKLWELHTGWLGLGLSLISAWIITNGMKNLFGKPRPDLLSRCQPDLANLAQYVVGGIANTTSNGQLVSANICTQTNKALLDDGFRSYPSGHSSSAAAGLIYLSLFIASKFSITLPFLAPAGYGDDSAFSAFPSRMINVASGLESYELVARPASRQGNGAAAGHAVGNEALSLPADPAAAKRLSSHSRTVAAVRRQAAAPPLYLLLLCVLPFFAAVFIASSRWFDFRHHGFDILFGFLIGTATAFFAFRYYHLPISQGAGWAWGPRSHDKAFWAGVGSFSYATQRRARHPSHDWQHDAARPGDEEEALDVEAGKLRPSHPSQQQQQQQQQQRQPYGQPYEQQYRQQQYQQQPQPPPQQQQQQRRGNPMTRTGLATGESSALGLDDRDSSVESRRLT